LDKKKCEEKDPKGTLKTLISPIRAQKLEWNEKPKCNLEGDQTTHL
jgi:hypothetical protein